MPEILAILYLSAHPSFASYAKPSRFVLDMHACYSGRAVAGPSLHAFSRNTQPPRQARSLGFRPRAQGAVVLDVRDLEARITTTQQAVLKGVSMTVREGEVHAIMGKNGSGKSTFSKVRCGGNSGYFGRLTPLA